jgi:hypothetical protein
VLAFLADLSISPSACLQDGTLSMDELCLLVERMIKEQERAM